jgi:hypothetical protein
MDKDGFGYWTVFTAGAGFFTGAYDVRILRRLRIRVQRKLTTADFRR